MLNEHFVEEAIITSRDFTGIKMPLLVDYVYPNLKVLEEHKTINGLSGGRSQITTYMMEGRLCGKIEGDWLGVATDGESWWCRSYTDGIPVTKWSELKDPQDVIERAPGNNKPNHRRSKDVLEMLQRNLVGRQNIADILL